MATAACANLNTGNTSIIAGMNPLENIELVMLQWGGKAQWFNRLTVRSVPRLEKSYLNVYSSLSVPIYFNSKRFSCFLWYSGRLSCWLAALREGFGWPELLSCLFTALPCKLSPTSLWKRNIWAWIIPSCCYTKGAANAFTVIQLYAMGKSSVNWPNQGGRQIWQTQETPRLCCSEKKEKHHIAHSSINEGH